MSNKVFHSDPSKDKILCKRTYHLLLTLKKLGLEFNIPIREIMIPLSLDGIMMDKFISAFMRCDDEDK